MSQSKDGRKAGGDMSLRQLHELRYHRERAGQFASDLPVIAYDIICSERRRWWNAQWTLFTWLMRHDLTGKKVLAAGCGLGDDALYAANLGADVHAFDLSPDMAGLASRIAQREGVDIHLSVMPVEKMTYEDDTFDCVIVRDLLHHADLPGAMAEIARVAKPGALVLIDEVYTHSWPQHLRDWRPVRNWLYPRLRKVIYGGDKPYITPDERKLSQLDVAAITKPLRDVRKKYFNFLTNRLYSHRFVGLTKLDALFLAACPLLAPFLGGRVLIMGRLEK